ncbi:D-arabinono-1,4-lactone oxidase [Isoptericola sp. b408]|uniref:D-arabinono-1,4-lactone oxidase n=1 Tax=Isoptericola sp. b408 TaxID=3064653 RepID=UPI0027126B12|nr:D-arabinono-1,4-lactone oxidase [Isoptericola sp. b408]MDO8150132.1 FAD-binding protein [Isoptericola sp. b408]
MRNWAGNIDYAARDLVRPTSLEELADRLVVGGPVRALGSRHSFNDLADTTGTHVQVDRLDDGRPAVDLDPGTGVVSVNAGMRYGEVSQVLYAHGRALTQLASLPHLSVAGAVATATHGSGDTNRSLAGAVVALELMTTAGELRRITRETDPEVFAGTVVSLGVLGIVTRIELTTVPAFQVRQDVALDLSWDAVLDRFDDVTGSAYSVSLFTRWDEPTIRTAWFKSVVSEGRGHRPDALPDLHWAEHDVHPVPGVDPGACTAQHGVPGPSHERLSHFRLDHTPSVGEELQSEYLLPRKHAVKAVEAMRGLGSVVAPLLMTGEVRTVAADDLWLSPFAEDSIGLHFTWLPRAPEVARVLPLIEETLAPFGARPHWGKVFTADPVAVRAAYPRFDEFRVLADRLDPEGRLRGGYVARLLG